MSDDKADMVERIKNSVPLMVVGPFVTTGCDCTVMPVNYWRLPDGGWQMRDLDPDRAEADAVEFAALGCTGWVLACPACHHVYMGGVAP